MDNERNPWDSLLAGRFGCFRLSTDDVPEKDRVAIVNDVVSRRLIRQEYEPLSKAKYYVRSDACVLPGLVAYRSSCSPAATYRTRRSLSDGNDGVALSWTDQKRVVRHLKREIALEPGEAILTSYCDESTRIDPTNFRARVIAVPRKALKPLLARFEDSFARPVPADSQPLRLLRSYLEILHNESSIVTHDLRQAVVAHVYDLLAIVLGARRDAEEDAKHRGIRAARLNVVKKTILESLLNSELSVSDIATRHRLTPRYVQMLFEDNGTTFTEFVRSERLARAYRLLSSPATRGRKILDVALSCGFGDLSHFNRAFRVQFGATPSDIRAQTTEAAQP